MGRLTALVTGANKGIGKEIARQLVEKGVTVYIGARDAGRGERAVKDIGDGARLLVLDVTDADSIAAAAGKIDDLDILVNNAGISLDPGLVVESDVDIFRRTYETNVFGVVAATNAFLPVLRASTAPRIVNVSSGTSSLTLSSDPDRRFAFAAGSGGAYRSSKAALNALTVLYSQVLAGEGFKVNALAPGLRKTDITPMAAQGGDPAEGAAGAVRLALLPDDGPTGQFFSWDGSITPW